MGYRLRNNLTPTRQAYLERLTSGPAPRDRSRIGFQCMMLGWTEWDYRHPDGTPTNAAEAREKYGSGWVRRVTQHGMLERLTDAGRRILKEQGQ